MGSERPFLRVQKEVVRQQDRHGRLAVFFILFTRTDVATVGSHLVELLNFSYWNCTQTWCNGQVEVTSVPLTYVRKNSGKRLEIDTKSNIQIDETRLAGQRKYSLCRLSTGVDSPFLGSVNTDVIYNPNYGARVYGLQVFGLKNNNDCLYFYDYHHDQTTLFYRSQDVNTRLNQKFILTNGLRIDQVSTIRSFLRKTVNRQTSYCTQCVSIHQSPYKKALKIHGLDVKVKLLRKSVRCYSNHLQSHIDHFCW